MYIRMPKANFNISNALVPNPSNITQDISVLPNGTSITISFPSGKGCASIGSYNFDVGNPSTDWQQSMAPTYAIPLSYNTTSGPFVNTGRNFLEGYDIAFDAIGGRFGLRQKAID